MTELMLVAMLAPILYLFYCSVEIGRRDLTRTENRQAAGIMACLFLLFLTEFLQTVLPLDSVVPLTVYVVLPVSFLSGGLATLLNARFASGVLPFNWRYILIPAFTPLACYLVLLLGQGSDAAVSGVAVNGVWRKEELTPHLLAILSGLLLFSVYNPLFCLWVLRRRTDLQTKRRMRLMLRTGIVYCLSNIVFAAAGPVLEGKLGMPPMIAILPTLIWAITLMRLNRFDELLPSASSKFQILYDISPAGILLLDSRMVIREFNPSALALFDGSLVKGQVSLADYVDADKREAFLADYRASFGGQPWRSREFEIRTAGGKTKTLLMESDSMNENGEWYMLAVVYDITSRKEQERRSIHEASHDMLTGLPNRLHFNRMLEGQLAIAREKNSRLAVLLIDLDRFKLINDTLGHPYGDQALIEIADRLRRIAGNDKALARLGGDEFVILLTDPQEYDEVIQFAELATARFREPLTILNREFYPAASIGISVFPQDGDTAELLTKHADLAMYEAKNSGGNQYRCYSHELSVRFNRSVEIESRLRKALERNEFVLHYQPQFHAQTGRLIGAEALLRWQSGEHGFTSPGEFIPLAEQTGLIVPIGQWVLEEACREAAGWESMGAPEMTVSVNVSAVQFLQPDFPACVGQALRTTGLRPDRLCLEVTESTVVSKLEAAQMMLRELAALGVRISLDDFGTGYSSLGVLQQLPIDVIKVDRSFVVAIPKDDPNRSIITAIVSMSRTLGKTTVVEGIEEQWQSDFVKETGCDAVQGYYFSRPVEPGTLAAMIRERMADDTGGIPRADAAPGYGF